MRAYTVESGRIKPGIKLHQDGIRLGEQGRGRTLTVVPPPRDAWVQDGTLVGINAPLTGALLLIRDHSGFRGGWELAADERHSTRIAYGACAQGIAGRAGGGPEYLLTIRPGYPVRITRTGRLYGSPAVLEVRCAADGVVTIHDVEAEARTATAAQAWGEVL